jgi:quinohemoprotein ethanol dehydrogenase
MRIILLATVALSALLLSACASDEQAVTARAGDVTLERVQQDNDPGNWYTTGRTFGETHYSPLSQINRKTVSDLGFAWDYATGTTRGLEATPVVVDGVMYATGTWGKVYALNAATGKELWTFVPKVDGQVGRAACCDVVNRGVAVWQGKVYVAALDGVLYALDAATGKIEWQVDTIVEHQRAYSVTGAPRIAGDVVVIGNGGAEFDARGYVSAYRIATGELAWRFYTVPGSPDKPREHPELEMAAATWDPNSRWQDGGGGTVWDSMVYDPELNLLYIGTGNSAPYAVTVRSPSGGDNLFLSSILAINPDSGRLVWHYQTTPGDSWDFTATQNMIFAELPIAGEQRKVIMQAPKNGFFYVLDRATGELLSAEAYVPVNWASHVDMKTGKPVQTEAANYFVEPKIQWPTDAGGHGWRPMAYNPGNGLVYIPAWEFAWLRVNLHPKGDYDASTADVQMGVLNFPPLPEVVDAFAPVLPYSPEYLKKIIEESEFPADTEYLRAWDPVAQKTVWEVDAPPVSGGGILTTPGLVIQGRISGELNVFDADSGELLHSIDTGTGIMAGAATYLVDGEQYVAVLAGQGGADNWSFAEHSAAYKRGNNGRIIAFKLGGGEVPLPPLVLPLAFPEPPPRIAENVASTQRGEKVYLTRCYACHANGDRNMLPDLRRLGKAKHAIFGDIVIGGALRARGMPQFDKILSEQEVADVQAYLIEQAWQSYEATVKLSKVQAD